MGYYYSNDYLEHHGILGQKWGIRRFQNKDGTRTAAGKVRAKEGTTKKGLTDEQKKYLKIGAAVIGTSLVVAGSVYLAKTGKLQAVGNKFVKKEIDPGAGDIPKLSNTFDSLPDLESSKIPKNVTEAFSNLEDNPLAHSHENDCCNVFLAFEGRARGKDVKPGWREDKSTLPYHEVCACFKEKTDAMGNSCFKERKNVDSLEKVTSLLNRYPDGSRGYASGTFTYGELVYTHAMSWSKEGGKITFGDGVNGINAGKAYEHIDPTQPFKYFRSDDLDFEDENYLKQVRT